jgi:4-oxalocrotonate tautomerase
MPIVRIELAPGRTREQKSKTAEAITQSIVTHCKCHPVDVQVVFVEVQSSDWAIGGRLLDEPRS